MHSLRRTRSTATHQRLVNVRMICNTVPECGNASVYIPHPAGSFVFTSGVDIGAKVGGAVGIVGRVPLLPLLLA